jgi:hypothetical protein
MHGKHYYHFTVEGTYMGKKTTLFINATSPLHAMKAWCRKMKANIELVAFSYVNVDGE